MLPEGYDYKRLEAKLGPEVDKYIGPQMQQAMGLTLAQFRQQGNQIGFALQPITDIHLHSDLTGDMEPYGDIRYIYIFSAVAVFMLLIACINFMNLSTAGASKRAKEVGIRKVMGSVKGQLVQQFLTESFILTFVALMLALGLVQWALPVFNDLAGQNLSLHLMTHLWVLPALIGLGLFIGFLAGSYPAFYLSSFNPVAVLKGRFASGKKSSGFRSGLVVFQFFISITLIVGTLVVYKQLAYIQHKKLGYDKDQVLVLQETYWLGHNQDAFRQQLQQDPRVLSVSSSGFLPAGSSDASLFYAYPDNHSSELVKTQMYYVDDQYIPTLGMEMASGRNFSKAFGSDSTGIIINETAARAYGWGENALGRTITHRDNDGKNYTYSVIGVVKDFHFKSLHELIAPLAMTLSSNSGSMIVKVKARDIAGLLASMKKEWKDFKPDAPFSYSFLDERFNTTYKAEQNIGYILGIFAGLTIFVACLGLFGLVTFTAEQRTKEIGIRKVLGASVTGIVTLLSKDFLKLVLLAFLIAMPVAWYVMNRWLDDFAYHMTINGWVFALTALLAMTLTFFTISFQAIKAAIANPVKSLRAE